jgi:hypothetical protein
MARSSSGSAYAKAFNMLLWYGNGGLDAHVAQEGFQRFPLLNINSEEFASSRTLKAG